jgi:uncharacterized protein involved in type VI secretion and phage assembly
MTAMTGPRPEAPGPGVMYGAYLAEVVSVKDEHQRGAVQVRLLGFDGVGAQDAPMWARVAVPFAGADRGAFMLPSRGDEVIVQFVNGDPRQPVVVGGLWNGAARPPETLGGTGDTVDRWSFVGKAGTRIAIVEEQGKEQISLSTPHHQVSALLTQESGGKIELQAAQCTITVDSRGVTIETAAQVFIKGSSLQVDAGTVTVNAGFSKFTGVVQCDVLKTTTVISDVYTPGAGNIW